MDEQIAVKAAVQILWLASGEIRVNYPTSPDGRVNDLLALGLLERGRMIVEEAIRKGAVPPALVQPATVVPRLNGGRGPHPLS